MNASNQQHISDDFTTNFRLESFLADLTNGRAYAAVLRPSSVVIVCNVIYTVSQKTAQL